jgi:hypothetical protein
MVIERLTAAEIQLRSPPPWSLLPHARPQDPMALGYGSPN